LPLAPDATGVPAPAAAAPAPAPAATVEPLPGPVWQPEDDDILPAGPANAVRGIQLGRRK
jgi:hypothetical protein